MLLLKPHDKPVGRGRKKTQGRFDQKKIFFDFFMLRRLESVFQDERKFFLKYVCSGSSELMIDFPRT